jgi:geranylgeranyl reductase family protein
VTDSQPAVAADTTQAVTGVPASVDVIVVGAGPSGAAAAYWLAREGHSVLIVERDRFPRDKACGDGLTPRAMHRLAEMGLGAVAAEFHPTAGLRVTAAGRETEVAWPEHPTFPAYGGVIRRARLDDAVAHNACTAGAQLLQGYEALSPLIERGFCRGAVIASPAGHELSVRAKYLVVADGANSGFGRSLGTFRFGEWPFAEATRGYWASRRSGEHVIESAIDITDRDGNALPGYGWVLPVGDGTLNIGVGLVSTCRDFTSITTAHLLEAYVQQIAPRWEIDPAAPITRPVSARIPMGGSVGPTAGPTYLVVGDAAASVNPFNGAGIEYAYETGRMAATVIHEALTTGSPSVLQRYPQQLHDAYGDYFKVARLFDRVIGRPAVMRRLARAGASNRVLLDSALRVTSNMMRPDHFGPAEAAYRVAARLIKLAPDA